MRVSLLGVEFYSENRGCGALAYSIVEILKQICKKKGDNLHITDRKSTRLNSSHAR